jgi:hypothetical protein
LFLGRKLRRSTFEENMKRVISFVIVHSLFVIVCVSTNAQWEGAEAQRLTYNTSRNEIEGLWLGSDDSLFLFYRQWNWDPEVQPYRDTLLVMRKAKDGEWSPPEKIGYAPFDLAVMKKYLAYDPRAGVTHLAYVSYPYFGRAETLYYANSNTPGWEPVKIDSLESGHEYVVPDIEVDSLGNAHVAWYEDYWSGGRWAEFWYANNSTGNWVKQAVSEPIYIGATGTWVALLAVEPNGTAHIAYGGAGVSECYYARNDSLNSENWVTDTIPRPSIPLCSHRYQELLADPSSAIHLFTRGYSCTGDTIFQFYYHKQGDDSLWSQPDLVQVHPPDSGLIQAYFIDQQGYVHLALTHFGGFSIIYTNDENGSWLQPELLLYELDAPGAGESFMFVIDSEGEGHGVYRGLDPSQSFWEDDSLEVYYYSPSNSSVDPSEESVLPGFALFQNYPNPFNSSTIINYRLRNKGHVTLKVYNILGKEVAELVSRLQEPGHYAVRWDGRNNQGKEVASGIYFCQLTAGDYKETKTLVLIR